MTQEVVSGPEFGADGGVGAKRIIWHVGFGRLLRRRGPLSVEVRDEVPLSDEPPRMDYLLIRKPTVSAVDDTAQTLRRLWPLLPLLSVVEIQEPVAPVQDW